MRDVITHVDAFFGDGDKRFDIHAGGFEHLIELQEKTGEGPFVTFLRLYRGQWRVADIREVLRLGLIGGGTSPSEAHKLITRYFEKDPLGEHAPLALAVMAAAIAGRSPDESPDGKADELADKLVKEAADVVTG